MSSIRQFKTAVTAAQLGSFTEAGHKVGLTQAAVGLQIKNLEQDLGLQLFVRSNQGLMVTKEGRSILARLETLIEAYEQLKTKPDDVLQGTVHMGALVSALMGSFGSALVHIKNAFPALDLRLFAGQSEEFSKRVIKGELDAAMVTEPPYSIPDGLIWKKFYDEPMVLICHESLQSHSVHHLLNTQNFLQFDLSLWTGRLVHFALEQLDITPRTTLELNSIEAIAQLVRQGYGVAIVPWLANAKWEEQQLCIKTLPGPAIVRRVGMLERRYHNKKPVTQALSDWFNTYITT